MQPLKINIHQDLYAVLPAGVEQRQAHRAVVGQQAGKLGSAKIMGAPILAFFLMLCRNQHDARQRVGGHRVPVEPQDADVAGVAPEVVLESNDTFFIKLMVRQGESSEAQP